jgi:hypothetical protein
MISIEQFRDMLSYDPETGIFRWLIKPAKNVHVGAIAGCQTRDGGWRIRAMKKEFPAAVMAFAMMTGRWPNGDVDHKDRNRANNKWSNLGR